MSLYKMIAIAIIAAGVFALIYGGFSFTTETHEAELGGITLSLDEKEYVNVPIWAGIAGIMLGAGMLLTSRKS